MSSQRDAAIRAISRDKTLSEREKMELLKRVVEQLRAQPKDRDELMAEFKDRTEYGFDASRLTAEDQMRLKFVIREIEAEREKHDIARMINQQFVGVTRANGVVCSAEDDDTSYTDVQQSVRNGISRTGKSSGLTQAQIDTLRASEEAGDSHDIPPEVERERLKRKIAELKRTTRYTEVTNPWG